MKVAEALRAFRKAVKAGRIVFHPHAAEMIEFSGLDAVFVARELEHAADGGLVSVNRNHPGRFVAHGRATIISFEVQPEVVVVTVMILE